MNDIKLNSESSYPYNFKFTGKKKVDKVRITEITFNSETFKQTEIQDLKLLINNDDGSCIRWINICGIHDPEILLHLRNIFNLHSLIIEDVMNVKHTPKYEDYGDYIFVIAKMIDLTPAKLLNIEQVSFILGGNYLLTFQEDEEDVFNNLRSALQKNTGGIRANKADYLMYRLLDAIIDNYFIVAEYFDQRIEILEDRVIMNYKNVSIEHIHRLRKEIITFRRAVSMMREVVFSLEKEKDQRVSRSTYFLLRDLYDHLNHIVESIDNFKENMNGMIDVYLSSATHRMNEVVKLLTIISTIFMPLTFIVGIYGMNFNTKSPFNMPELNWQYGYPVIMIFMGMVAAAFVIYFKRKKWF